MKRMDLKKIGKRRYRDGIIILALAWLAVLDMRHSRPPSTSLPLKSYSDATTQYCATPISDTNTDLVGYELHRRVGDYGKDYSCSAIIKSINPETDDYKKISRAIVADIIRIVGSDNISVTIYDDHEAYIMGEVGFRCGGFDSFNTDKLNQHVVAFFDREHEYSSGDARFLTYYTYAANKYTEQDVY